MLETEAIDSYTGILKWDTIKGLIPALGLSMLIVWAALFISSLFPKGFSTSIAILSITTLGIAFSFVSRIRALKKTFQFGMYIIYIFCLVVGSMASFDRLKDIDPYIMAFVVFSISGTMLLHALLCRIFKVDTDTFLITSTSAICSPPFVPVVAAALRNKEIILSGLSTGIIGYAIGNYLGISFGYLFHSILG